MQFSLGCGKLYEVKYEELSNYTGIVILSEGQCPGILMFARTLSSSSSLVLPAAGINPLCASQ